jgi:hypothetical protein
MDFNSYGSRAELTNTGRVKCMGMDEVHVTFFLSFFFINLFFANLLGDYSFAHLHEKQLMDLFRKRFQKREQSTFLNRGNEVYH